MRSFWLVTLLVGWLSGTVEAQGTCPSGCPSWLVGADGCCPKKPIKVTQPGTLALKSNVEGTRVKIARRTVRLPARSIKLAPGVYKLEATTPGYASRSDVVLVRPGEAVTLQLTFCERGKHASGSTCCWDNQVADQHGSCTGTPRCPPFHQPSGADCRQSACPSGMDRVESTCCWPGQRLHPDFGVCIGAPSRCPAGYERGFGGCIAADEDGDGLATDVDRCPSIAEDIDGFEDSDGCIDADNDRDGILDTRDRCRERPEDRDGHEDTDGCPDLDDDGDRILDPADRCPRVAEDRDGIDDGDGCPDPDDDRDGIADAIDRCPHTGEDRDGFEDGDGCRDPDDDRDGIDDVSDHCPRIPESVNGFEDRDGCSDEVPSATRLFSRRPLAMRYGAGVSQGGVRVSTPSAMLESSSSLTSTVTVEATRGFEVGFLSQCAYDGASCLGTAFIGLSPLQVGSWKQGYGSARRVWFDPFLHLLATPTADTTELRLALGSRLTWDERRGIWVVIGYETSSGAIGGGGRVGIELVPRAARTTGPRSRPPFGLQIIANVVTMDADDLDDDDPRLARLLTALVSFGGLAIGATHHQLHGTLPTAELAMRWHAEPFVRMLWYPDAGGPGATLGLRLPMRFLKSALVLIEGGYEIGPGPIPSGFVAGFGWRKEM